MGIAEGFKLKKITSYGFVKEGKFFGLTVKLERELGGEKSKSERLMFVKDNIVLGIIPLGEKIIGYVSENEIADYQNSPKQPDGSALITLIYKNGERSKIYFYDNNRKLSFLRKLNEIQNGKSDLIKEIEQEK